MKNIKILFVIILTAVFFLPLISAKADGIELKSNNVSDLNTQIFFEIKNVLSTPLYLNFTDKNIKGETTVILLVDKNGKIVISGIKGENDLLNNQVQHKIESRNMWTDTKFSGNTFTIVVNAG
ncbi:MAG: hypothetical protein NTV87_04005 [Ignavibacteriae bacterium]|jgi:uncharacterized membrane protein|nr:hypothetical protein [Ignavibacteriota bacterium]